MQTINPPHASNPDTAVARKTHRRVVKLVDDAGGLARLRHDHGRRSSSLMSAEHVLNGSAYFYYADPRN